MAHAQLAAAQATAEPVARVAPGTVSFVIPNYNHARYLGAAIASALAQTHPHVEVIVVDDGSTDASRTVAAGFGSRIHYLYQDNAGLSAARNAGVLAAQGDYIALLDADDVVDPTYAARLLAALVQTPDAAGAYCGYRFIDQDDQPLARVEQRIVPPAALYAALLNGNYWVPESLLARRACYEAMGEFDTSLRACEDWDVWLRFSRHYRLVGIDDVLIEYRVVVGSMSSDPRRMLDNRLAVLAKHVGSRPVHGGQSPAHQAYAYAFLRTALEYFQAGDSAAGYANLRAAACTFPRLLVDHASYYELACSEQGRGSQGDAGQLDIVARQRELFAIVHRLSADAALRTAWRQAGMHEAELRPARLRAPALWAIGMLHYQAGALSAGRAALLQAGRYDPSLFRDRRFCALFVRCLLGARQVELLKRARGRS